MSSSITVQLFVSCGRYAASWSQRHSGLIWHRSVFCHSTQQQQALVRALHQAAIKRGWQFNVLGG